jgi:hypothetical protein
MSGYGMMLCLCGFLLLVLSSLAFRFVLEIFLLFFFCVLSPIEQSKADTVIDKLPWTIGVPLGLSTSILPLKRLLPIVI